MKKGLSMNKKELKKQAIEVTIPREEDLDLEFYGALLARFVEDEMSTYEVYYLPNSDSFLLLQYDTYNDKVYCEWYKDSNIQRLLSKNIAREFAVTMAEHLGVSPVLYIE